MRIRTLDDFMPPVSPADAAEWEELKTELEKEIRFASSLDLLKHGAGLSPVIKKAWEDEYVVIEKVAFESLPGFFVTGNLYRPKDISKKYPAVLNPHGHWENGRLETVDLAMIPTRCYNFARRGMVAFIYDMIGFHDSRQMPHEGFEKEYELYNFGRFSLQLNNSVKAVDFVSSLPYVDAEKIGCTGCSGGGTQTYFLTAVEPRIKASAPINMSSGRMQGGCICENTAFLRVKHSNTDFTMLAAPRPLFMAACDGDWTWDSVVTEFPAIKKIYGFYGAQDKFETFYRTAPHCYEKCTRELAYSFFCRAFGIRDPYEGELEADIDLSALVFGDEPFTGGVLKNEREIFAQAKEIIRENLKKLGEEEQKDLIARVFALGDDFDCDIPYVRRQDGEKTVFTFGDCPAQADRMGVKYYHCYNYADDSKRVNALKKLMEENPFAVFRAGGKTAALCAIAARLAGCGEIQTENADETNVFIPGFELVKNFIR